MNKNEVLEKIQLQVKNLENWQGLPETLTVAKQILKITEDTVDGTQDSPIYHQAFEGIALNLNGVIGNNRNNYNAYLNAVSSFLTQLTPLSISNSVNTLRISKLEQEELIVKLKATLEQSNESIALIDDVAKKQRIKHEIDMDQIKKSHNEQLEFEVPLRTWLKASKGYNKQGKEFLRLLVGLTLFSSVALVLILLFTPDKVLLMFSGQDKSAAIRWSFTFFILIGFLAYSIRAVAKAMFSSFHLARDADERALLTKYYLGLIRKGSLEPSDRAIVMQSLFSRSDTGMLKDDGSPTMAGDLIAKVKQN